MFDNITYNKAAAVIRMLEAYVGEEAFRAGLRQYLRAHAYGNATSADLWHAIEGASGKPVGTVAAAFINQRGFPLVVAETACADNRQQIRLRQERFTLRPANAASGPWQVPITIGQPGASEAAQTMLLHDQPKIADGGRCGTPMKLNLDDIGYYRVEYDAATRVALMQSMPLLSPADRVNLLADAWALVEAGRAAPPSYLDLVERIARDDSPAVWRQIVRTLNQIDRLQQGRAERAAFRSYARARLRPVFDRLAWDGPNNDGDGGGMLRPALIRFLGELGDEDVIAEAKRRFAAFLQDHRSLRPGLRDTVIHIVGVGSNPATYEILLSLARASTDARNRERYYLAAASARDPALAQKTLALILDGDMPPNIAGKMLRAVAWEGEHAQAVWTFLQRNYRALVARPGSSFGAHDVASFMKDFSDRKRAAELANFAPLRTTAQGRAAARRAEEEIRFSADFKARVLPEIDAWISQRASAQ
jgi:aminopeptidase N